MRGHPGPGPDTIPQTLMNRRYLPVAGITFVLALVALAGYLAPEAHPEIPLRVRMDNSAGPVVFDHEAHDVGYDIECVACHHATKVSTTEVPCETCHPADFDQAFIENHVDWFEGKAACEACHHLEWGRPIFDHTLHEEMLGDCQSCHHGPEIEPQPMSCRNCHEEEGDARMPSLKNAVHDKCRDCHADMFEEELSGCSNCHSRKNLRGEHFDDPTTCRACHDKPNKDLIPTRKDAFHQQCLGCHEKRGKGPWRMEGDDKQCGACHLPQP